MKKKLGYVFLLPLFAGLLSACSEAKTDARALEGEWKVVEVSGEKIGEEPHPLMSFDMEALKLHGNTGCNLFNSSVTLDPKDIASIKIAPGATTMMACPNMDLEENVLQAMSQVRKVKAGNSEKEMLLLGEDDTVLFILERR